jgi:tRNA 2-selenouridine synthase
MPHWNSSTKKRICSSIFVTQINSDPHFIEFGTHHVLGATPLLDVRSPIEFADGSAPGAVNLPLLSNDERHQVGLTYKTRGQEAAIELGHRLVSVDLRESRVQAWLDYLNAHPSAVIYCARGGLRSQTVQSWLADKNRQRPVIHGGYKSIRRFFIDTLERLPAALEFKVIAGPTGSGKTDYLGSSNEPSIDLEKLARHRGSAFGAMSSPQPCQANFENELATELIKKSRLGRPILIEDESQRIGHRLIPRNLFDKMLASERIMLDIPIETRIDKILREYVSESSLVNKGDLSRFAELRQAVQAIARKLGTLRAEEILNDLRYAEHEFVSGRGLDSNRVWIRKLLEWYYDPFYEFAKARTK